MWFFLPISVVIWWIQVDALGWPDTVYPDQLILHLRCCAHWSQHLCCGRPGHRSVRLHQVKQRQISDKVTVMSVFECVRLVFPACYRNELRLHSGVSPQHWDVASHKAHVTHWPLQNSLRCATHRQLSTVPPSVEPGHVPNPNVTLAHELALRRLHAPLLHTGNFYLL